jgi:SPP1 gp7 family putative phage head morphogenesis protein
MVKLKRAKPIKLPIGFEVEFLKFLRFMSSSIKERIENKLKGLNKSTIEKFTDADGNYVNILEGLFTEAQISINKQFGEDRIKAYLKELYLQVNKKSVKNIALSIKSVVGVDIETLLKGTREINEHITASILKSVQEVLKFRNDQFERYKMSVLREALNGKGYEGILTAILTQKKPIGNLQKIIARNEIKAFFSTLTQKRFEQLGIEKAIWQTSGDERVRTSHRRLDGKEYDINTGIKDDEGNWIKPGSEMNCRCISIPVIPEDWGFNEND